MIENKYYQEDLKKLASLPDLQLLDNHSFLITGATGLICSFLIDVLMYRNINFNTNMKIYALSRNEDKAKTRFKSYWDKDSFCYMSHDIVYPLSIENQVDFVIHGASNASPSLYVSDPVGTMKANIWGCANLLELSKKTNARMLYVSSGEVYGEGNGMDFAESYSGYIDCLNSRSCYPSSKRAAESLCVSYKEQYGIEVVIARPCHIYGPTMTLTDGRAIAQFLQKALSNEDIILKSSGCQVRSYCYVEDCVKAMLYILLFGKAGEAYNIANQKSIVSISEIANAVASVVGKRVVRCDSSLQEAKGYSLISRAVLDSSKLEKLGWIPNYSMSDGVKRTFQILEK